MLDWFNWLNSPEFFKAIFNSGGSNIALLILFAILFAETGLLVGFFLPGDTLLLFVGAALSKASSTGEPLADIWLVNFVMVAGAVVGDQLGYFLGSRTGAAIFKMEDSHFFKKKHVTQAHDFYVKHGPTAVIVARFVPLMRTFVPFLAGVAAMEYRKFVLFSITGGILWVTTLLWIGYSIGRTPIADYLHYLIAGVVMFSLMPMAWAAWRSFFSSPRNKAVADTASATQSITGTGVEPADP
ncbi:MAG TPA: VTT domain-containing protein [Candidatus Methylacidiphilales bacterium]|nr:VTT domain-containing protein [Candidatus Methylacidiphilales bacterium]